MSAALFSKSVDAVIAGEPLMAKTEMDGYGRVLFMTKDALDKFRNSRFWIVLSGIGSCNDLNLGGPM